MYLPAHFIFFFAVSGELIEEEEQYEAKIDDEETSENLDKAKALELQGRLITISGHSCTCIMHI